MRGAARRFRITAGVGALVAVTALAACSDGAGTVEQPTKVAPSYTALSLGSMKAHMGKAVDGAIAYSPDGTTAVVRKGSSICIVAIGGKDSGSGRVCPKMKGSRVSSLAFSPDGDTLALAADGAADFKGGLWLVSTETGTVRSVPMPSPSRSTAPKHRRYRFYQAVTWPSDGDPIAMATMPDGKEFAEHLVRIDTDVAKPHDLGAVTDPGVFANSMLVSAGNTIVFGATTSKGSKARLVTFDLTTKKSSTVTPTGQKIDEGTQILPMALSPDGKRAAVAMSNPATYQSSPPAQVDVTSGVVTTVTGTAGTIPIGAAYAPDGSQVAFLTDVVGKQQSQLFVARVDGGAKSLLKRKRLAGFSFDLQWTTGGLLVPRIARGTGELGDLAPISLSS